MTNIARAGIRLPMLPLSHSALVMYKSFSVGGALITLDVQIGMPYLYYMPMEGSVRRGDVPPPQSLRDATSAWLNSYHDSIDYKDFIVKMFGEYDDTGNIWLNFG